jgi:hypothetical protein
MAKRKEKAVPTNDNNDSFNFEEIKNSLGEKKQMTPTARIDFDPKFKHSYNHDTSLNGYHEIVQSG